MKLFFRQQHRLLFYAAWIMLGLMQSGLTELQDDEAYYWVYSKYLDIGYFDHPPMIALLVKMGYAIFPNELGVRLFPLLLNVLSLVIIEKLLKNKNDLLFYSIALSIAVLQLAGFTAVPDIPLIFFTALFFLFYKKFDEKQSVINSLLLAVTIALLFYTKYHAVLIVFFTFLSNLKHFTKPQLYLSGIVSLLLFSPHLFWQWEHNWISFRYHLFESNVNPYKFSHTTEYLGGQFLIAGPLAGFILLPAAFLYKSNTATEKALKWTMTGIYVFFLLSSFRGKVETNWTSPVLVPLIVLSHQYLNERLSWQKWLLRLLPLSFLLVMCMRVFMIIDILPVKAIQKRYHAWKEWPQQMKQLTNGLPIVFSNSYQRASKYWFYTGQITYSQNDVREHRNNYNFWPVEDELLGKPVYFLDIYRLNRFTDSLKTPVGHIGYRYDSSFLSFGTVNLPFSAKDIIHQGDSLHFQYGGIPMIGRNQWLYLHKFPQAVFNVHVVFFHGKKIIAEIPVSLDIGRINEKLGHCSFTLKPDLPKGHYKVMLSFAVPGYNPTHNSEKIELVVE
jgi:Dolichyl-phosphate-mannose-protein mannosyltransferase